ncbi:beta-ketoacyl-[acyl-carrier-protein] synthase family protein [Xinfangfangia sp. D13-10-4-6]|uniref:beta-ketoacyl-[acyl-carrier-protein] synthase family protein n=1 Tax=Pseudogemmobacter hezensis TaxID=2737662 RepID=UPI001553EB00|nr:beta-ketoacyl-[acyl-carrier-protein] synthase family protein [Pseudogemmobacter hezensis]NPD13628.1 beta-ketoacyl-[acyl-carrier-protein] synthase family protein [Pseudogemmobacter hezensis]
MSHLPTGNSRRVVITGAGTVNALAHDLPGTYAALAAGRSGIGALEFRDADRLSIRIGAQIRGWEGAADLTPQQTSLYDPFTRYALAAAAEALAMAGTGAATGAGVIIGSAAGGIQTWEDNYRAVYAEGKNRVPPLTVPRLMMNAAASHIAMRHGLQGPAFAVSSACSSSNHAIGQAFRLIRDGHADAMLAGGAEAMLCFGGIKAWEGLRVLSPDGCRPFAASRNGMVMGEGAAVFMLEEAGRAKARDARVLAELAGFGMTADAGDIVAPSVQGAAGAMQAALQEAGLGPGDIGYINAHGTGTRVNDRTEVAAIRAVFGADSGRLMVSSTKAMHGHAIGATGALELIACLMALDQGIIAPTINYDGADPECDLDHVPNEARRASIGAALSNSFAFGGLNAVLALRSADQAAA